MLTGGCFCGEVRYEAQGGAADASLCHCVTCRRTSGAPAVAWVSVPAENFRFTKGRPRTVVSSSVGERSFCGDCGTLLAFRDSRHEEVDVTIASLDDPAATPIVDQIWVKSRLPWMVGLDTLPELPQGHSAPPPPPLEDTPYG